jgi:hypothetical protein
VTSLGRFIKGLAHLSQFLLPFFAEHQTVVKVPSSANLMKHVFETSLQLMLDAFNIPQTKKNGTDGRIAIGNTRQIRTTNEPREKVG